MPTAASSKPVRQSTPAKANESLLNDRRRNQVFHVPKVSDRQIPISGPNLCAQRRRQAQRLWPSAQPYSLRAPGTWRTGMYIVGGVSASKPNCLSPERRDNFTPNDPDHGQSSYPTVLRSENIAGHRLADDDHQRRVLVIESSKRNAL
jgi:hypothetical protein